MAYSEEGGEDSWLEAAYEARYEFEDQPGRDYYYDAEIEDELDSRHMGLEPDDDWG